MSFRSILFDRPAAPGELQEAPSAPDFFVDLNLDAIIESMTAGREEYELRPFFYAPLRRLDAVNYRYEALRDLEQPSVLTAVGHFARCMKLMRQRRQRADGLRHAQQKQRWFLDAVKAYCDAVQNLAGELDGARLRARGWQELRTYLAEYTHSEDFRSLLEQTRRLAGQLAAIRYCLRIVGRRIEVRRYEGETDYSVEITATFEKFQRDATKEYRFGVGESADMGHVEAAILERVALLFPETFAALERYCEIHRDFMDARIRTFDREVQFYLACLDHFRRIGAAGLPFCYPAVSDHSRQVHAQDAFDLALAEKLIRDHATVVTNDFSLHGHERVLVVTGPNQGGKSTFARMFGQLHYLASIGSPIPGRAARLFLFDRLFTHFDREEAPKSLRGKLEQDLRRVQDILGHATSSSILIMNESFSSTSLGDALFLNKRILQQIIERGLLCVAITFLDELASLGEATVSMVSTVDEGNRRTFKILRRPANGMAYAATLAHKYRLTFECIKERTAS